MPLLFGDVGVGKVKRQARIAPAGTAYAPRVTRPVTELHPAPNAVASCVHALQTRRPYPGAVSYAANKSTMGGQLRGLLGPESAHTASKVEIVSEHTRSCM